MSVIEELLKANESYAQSFTPGGSSVISHLRGFIFDVKTGRLHGVSA